MAGGIRFSSVVLALALLSVSSHACADWFVSSDTKALMVKAEAGDAESQFRVGNRYDAGRGAPHDKKEAAKWYRLAAQQGYAEAQNSLGSLLQEDKQYSEARDWYEKASVQGHALATNSLAYLYDLGLGVPQDRRKGFELYSKAADLGWGEAMWNLANMYGGGQIGPVDFVMACVWSGRAKRFAPPEELQLQAHLKRVIPLIEGRLSIEQNSTCRQQVESWAPSQTALPHPS